MGENIGAAARVMQNFGLHDLRIVAPRDGWPNEQARSMAAKAVTIVDAATLYETTQEAVADLRHVLATTARERQMNKPAVSAHDLPQQPMPEAWGIMFGPERTGLENEDIAAADQLLYVPTAPENPSLNLAQAVAVVAYSWSQSALEGSYDAEQPATKEELQGLYAQLETALDEAHFWKVDEKKPAMWLNIRAMLQRAELTEQEVRTWRGIIRALGER